MTSRPPTISDSESDTTTESESTDNHTNRPPPYFSSFSIDDLSEEGQRLLRRNGEFLLHSEDGEERDSYYQVFKSAWHGDPCIAEFRTGRWLPLVACFTDGTTRQFTSNGQWEVMDERDIAAYNSIISTIERHYREYNHNSN